MAHRCQYELQTNRTIYDTVFTNDAAHSIDFETPTHTCRFNPTPFRMGVITCWPDQPTRCWTLLFLISIMYCMCRVTRHIDIHNPLHPLNQRDLKFNRTVAGRCEPQTVQYLELSCRVKRELGG